MAEFTFLELHFEDSDLTAYAPFSRGGDEQSEARDEASREEADSNRGAVLAAIVGLCFCVIVAYVVRTRVFGDESADRSAVEA